MQLLSRGVVGARLHRSGWPRVMKALRSQADGRGMLLDDFVEASFCYNRLKSPHLSPWVGIFHHPIYISSCLPGDRKNELRHIANHPFWAPSLAMLRGAIALCDEVAVHLGDWLKVPVLSLLHPTEASVPRWDEQRALQRRCLAQAGFYLRNTQLIFQINRAGWHRVQVSGATRFYRSRDRAIRRRLVRPDIERGQVEVRQRLNDTQYDELLAESVMVTELYGAAANNLVVECMVRGTPLLVNRLPSVEQYLGTNYPLFYSNASQATSLLEAEQLRNASTHLLACATHLPTFEQFAERINDFCRFVETP